MSKGKSTMQKEYNKYKSAFYYGQQAIVPLSNDELNNKKRR